MQLSSDVSQHAVLVVLPHTTPPTVEAPEGLLVLRKQAAPLRYSSDRRLTPLMSHGTSRPGPGPSLGCTRAPASPLTRGKVTRRIMGRKSPVSGRCVDRR